MKEARAILLCGKLCCGKSTYAEKLKMERNAPILSCDELMLKIFDERLGESHERVAEKAQSYLLNMAAELLSLTISVILEWGFWTKESREKANRFFQERGFQTELHYIDISDETWEKNIQKRNGAQSGGSYFVDEGLLEKCRAVFEPPYPEEIDIRYRNDWE